MTNKEAIKYLIMPVATSTRSYNEYLKQKEAYDLAVKALKDVDRLQEIVDKRIAEMVERPRDEWVRKEDITQYIATQYSEHNELVPTWLKIGDLKGSKT